jgi:glycine dehydrogenase subunit 2
MSGARPEPTLFELSSPGRRGVEPPPVDPGLPSLAECVPADRRRSGPLDLPELGELEAVRHYTRLSQRNMSIDTHFYPLGSCTMKYNPRLNEAVAALPGFRKCHPLASEAELQGWFEVYHRLERILAEVSGLPHVSLQPAAGAHGELTALFILKAYHEEREPGKRSVILVPDSAHGTNPSSCTIAGFEAREVRSGPDGAVSLEDFRSKLGPEVAGMMITNPNTLGLFEPRIREVSEALHRIGAFLYMDGANMNAILGITRPGDFGVDIMHFNLHKTFSTPHGGGGPGSGPVACRKLLEPYLPVPRVVRNGDRFAFDVQQAKSIGKVKSFWGNIGMHVRAYAYLRFHGPDGIRRNAEHAVLNANYLLSRLKKTYKVAYPRLCMHEFVLDGTPMMAKTGVRTLDVAKRLLDFQFHPPTIYFPLIVHEALMIEPTESESKETLDAFADALLKIAEEAKSDPEKVKTAPHTMPVRRLNEVKAAKEPIVRCPTCLG